MRKVLDVWNERIIPEAGAVSAARNQTFPTASDAPDDISRHFCRPIWHFTPLLAPHLTFHAAFATPCSMCRERKSRSGSARFYLTWCIYYWVLGSQLHHQTVNSIFELVIANNKLTIVWRSWFSETDWQTHSVIQGFGFTFWPSTLCPKQDAVCVAAGTPPQFRQHILHFYQNKW